MRKNLKMKWLFTTILAGFITLTTYSQTTACTYELEEKTDSTQLKVLPQKLMYEKVFGTSKKFIQFKLLQISGIPTLNIQVIEKNEAFIATKCVDLTSKIIFQLQNGKYITLKSISDNSCSILTYNAEEKANIRVLEAYFVFTKHNYEALKTSPISIMRIQYAGDKEDLNIASKIQSEVFNESFYPATFFIDHLHCVDK